MIAMRSGRSNGKSRHKTAYVPMKVVFATPIASASVRMAPAVNHRSLARIRHANRTSARKSASQTIVKPGLANRELLHPEIADFADVKRVLGAAIDGVDGAELLRQFAGLAEPADHRSVELHLVDLAGGVEVVRWIGIRDVEDLVCARRDADGLGVADVLDLALEGAVVVEHLDALVATVSRVDVALRVDRD